MLFEIALVGGSATLWQKSKRKKNNLIQSLAKQESQKSTFNSGKLVQDLVSAIFGDERQQLQMKLDPKLQIELEARKKEENRKLILSSGAMGVAALGTLSPVFYILGSAAVIYLIRPLLSIVYQDFKQGHFVSVQLVTLILIGGMIATGHLILSAAAGFMGGLLVKLIRKAEDSSQRQLVNIFAEHPNQVWLDKGGVEVQVAFKSLKKDDIVVVNAGEIIPVDGLIQSGSASVDQRILTGESQPVDKEIGDPVFAATLVLAGRISIRVETAGEETVAANIGHVLNNTQNYKDNLMLRGKKIADRLLPVEVGIAALTFGMLGTVPAIAVLWSGLGARMTIYGPISVLNYMQLLARQGILVKDGRVLESLREVDTVVFDKTGTLTHEQPSISDIYVLTYVYDQDQILYAAACAEHRQTHPVARAILDKAVSRGMTLAVPDNVRYEVGYGISVYMGDQLIRVGSARFMEKENLVLPELINDLQQQANEHGHSLIYVSINNTVAGILEMSPSIRPEVPALIQTLKKRGITTYIISGDHEQPTRNIALQLGIDHYFAEILPENKAVLINGLREEGKFVCFIGDGINDTIALKSAHISISLKGASSAATDTAQIIFMDGTLNPLTNLLYFSDEFEHTMHNNLLLSVVPGVLNIAGVYLLHFGIAASMGLFYTGTATGLINTVLPLAKHQRTFSKLPEPT